MQRRRVTAVTGPGTNGQGFPVSIAVDQRRGETDAVPDAVQVDGIRKLETHQVRLGAGARRVAAGGQDGKHHEQHAA
jgi:hypothetical protein